MSPDSLGQPLRKLIRETDDALIASWLRALTRGQHAASDPRRQPPPDIRGESPADSPVTAGEK